jgi:hypothetical protein
VETEVVKVSRKSTLTKQGNEPVKTKCRCLMRKLNMAMLSDSDLLSKYDAIYKDIKDDKYRLDKMVIELTEKPIEEEDTPSEEE